jgi:hypothetical protein
MKIEQEFYEIIASLAKRDALKHLVLIGSWALCVYEESEGLPGTALVTQDIDFLVKQPRGPFPKGTPNIYEILREQGYRALTSLVDFNEKYIPDKTETDNELRIEFLCQPGRHVQDAYRIKELGITAQSLQYQSVLLANVVRLPYRDILVDVPVPVVWAIHKIAISQLRTGENREFKMQNDINVTSRVIEKIGEKSVLSKAHEFKGKFLQLFKKGWEIYKESNIAL